MNVPAARGEIQKNKIKKLCFHKWSANTLQTRAYHLPFTIDTSGNSSLGTPTLIIINKNLVSSRISLHNLLKRRGEVWEP